MMLEQDYRYILEPKTIGRGTFSHTQKATIADEANTAIAAGSQGAIVKTLAFHLRELPDFWRFKRRFSKLAHRLADCQHPHLARVIDCFEEDGQPYVVYEAIAGRSLADILEVKGALPRNLALRYIKQIAGAIATLHNAGLLHLDLSPSNIIQRQDKDEVVAVEFGLTAELTPAIKQTRANLLSPGYAAPEQHQPQAFCTPATDIYALCATLYALLNGNPPPPAPVLDIIERDRWQHFPADLPKSIKAAILQGLSLNPQERPQSVEAWQSLLDGTVTALPSRENLAGEPLNAVESNPSVTPSIINEVSSSQGSAETTPRENQTEGREIFEEKTLEVTEERDTETLPFIPEVPPSEPLEETTLQEAHFTEIPATEPERPRDFSISSDCQESPVASATEEALATDRFPERIELQRSTVQQEVSGAIVPKEIKIKDINRAEDNNPIAEKAFDPFEKKSLESFAPSEEVYTSELLEKKSIQKVSPTEELLLTDEEQAFDLEADSLYLDSLLISKESPVLFEREEAEIQAFERADGRYTEGKSIDDTEVLELTSLPIIEEFSPSEEVVEETALDEVNLAEARTTFEPETLDDTEVRELTSLPIIEEFSPSEEAVEETILDEVNLAETRTTFETEPTEATEVRELTSLPIIEEFSPSEEAVEETALDEVNLAEARTTFEAEPIENAVEGKDLASFALIDAQQLPEHLETSNRSNGNGNGKHVLTREELQSTKMVLWWLSRTNFNPASLKPKFPMRTLMVTCAIAASAGAGLGISVRVNRPEEAGSSVWHLKQSFPPRDAASPTIEEEY